MELFICRYCSSQCKNHNSFINHERMCKLNPSRIISEKTDKWYSAMAGKTGNNQYTKAKETGIPYEMKDSTREKHSINGIQRDKNGYWTEERRESHSVAMSHAVVKHPNSYSSGNRGRVKRIQYDGLLFQGNWELCFYKWCKQNNISVAKCDEWFEYEFEGTRKYFPDFILKDYNVYVEVKGYKTKKDEAKWSQFKKKLLIVESKDIDSINNNTYDLLYNLEMANGEPERS